MTTVKKQVIEIIDAELFGHPSREDQMKIERLEQIVLMLAEKIDVLIELQPYNIDAYLKQRKQ